MSLRACAGVLTAAALLAGCHSGAGSTAKTGAATAPASVSSVPAAARPREPACTRPAIGKQPGRQPPLTG